MLLLGIGGGTGEVCERGYSLCRWRICPGGLTFPEAAPWHISIDKQKPIQPFGSGVFNLQPRKGMFWLQSLTLIMSERMSCRSVFKAPFSPSVSD